jgi:glutamate carboxypeptidase
MEFTHKLPDMLALLRLLVEAESSSHDKAGVDRVAAIVIAECRRMGARLEIQPQTSAGDLIIACWGEGKHPILLLCHMDTVFPAGTLVNMPFYEKEGKVFGPGVLDMKGGIVVALASIQALLDLPKGLPRPVTALFTSDEETGSSASRPWIEKLARESSLALVLESGLPDGAVKTWRKGVGDFTVRVHGRAAHAGGDHEKGRNAIEEMAHQVLAIQKLTDYTLGTTLNVGVVHGGTASNVVPEQAVAEVDVRILQPAEAERITRALQALRPVLDGTSIEVSGGLNRPPMPFDETMKATFERARAIAAGVGIDLKAGGSGGGSDGNFVAALGTPVLDGLGPAGEGYHSEREYFFRDSLAERAKLLTALLSKF